MTTSRTFENYLVAADSVRRTRALRRRLPIRVRVSQSLFRTRAVVGCVCSSYGTVSGIVRVGELTFHLENPLRTIRVSEFLSDVFRNAKTCAA